MPKASPQITAAYRVRLATGKAGLLALLRALWTSRYDPANPQATLAAIGALAGVLTVRQQAAAVTQARGYLAALTAHTTGQHVSTVQPFAIPEGLVGSSAQGVPLSVLTGLAPVVYSRRVQAGQDPGMAADASLAWLNRLAASEPYRAANETVTTNADDDPRLPGRMERETGPSPCSFCAGLADQGYSAANAGFAAHANCQCTAVPEM